MSNVVEFVLRMKDMMSSNMTSAAIHAKQRLKEVESAVDRIPQSFNRQSGAMGAAGSSLGQIFKGNFLAIIGTELVSGITNIMGSVGSKIVSSLFDKEKTLAGLKTFVSDDIGKTLFDNMSNSFAANIFDSTSLINATKGLIGAGEDAVKAQSDILSLANAIVGSGGGQAEFDRMASNLQQIKTLGTATAMDIKQFGIANMNVYKMLSDATGKSIAEVKEMNVSYELLSNAIQKAGDQGGLYFGAIENFAKTLPGLWALATNKVAKGFGQLGDALKPSIGVAMNFISEIASKIPSLIIKAQPVLDIINNTIISAFEGIKNLINGTSEWSDYLSIAKEFVGGQFHYLKEVLKVIGHIGGGIINWIKQSWILRDLYALIKGVSMGIWNVVVWIADKIKWIWDNVVSPMLNAIESVYRWLRGGEDIQATVKVVNDHNKILTDDNWKIDNPYLGTGKYAPKAVLNSTGETGIRSGNITNNGPKSIIVNIQKEMIGKLEINSMNIREGIGEMENLIKEHLYRLLISLETAN